MKKSVVLILAAMLAAFFLCGAACEHSVGQWLAEGDEMHGECSLCKQELSLPIDRQLLAESALVGEWVSTYSVFNGQEADMSNSEFYTFYDDHSYTLQIAMLGSQSGSELCTWEFDGYDEATAEEPEKYHIKCTLANGSYNILTLLNVGTASSCELYYGFSFADIGFETHYKKLGDESLEIIEPLTKAQVMEHAVGSWHSYEKVSNMATLAVPAGEQSGIVLSSDGSCEYTAAGESSRAGTWALTSEPQYSNGRHSCKMELLFNDGSSMELTFSEDKSEDEASRLITHTTGDILQQNLISLRFAKD